MLRSKIIITIIFIILSFKTFYSQDYLFFTDSENQNYYDPSWLFSKTPSELLKINSNKFPVSNDTLFSGTNSLKLSWISKSSGDWGAAVAAPGWPGRDITLKDSISFWVFSNNEINALSLPLIYLEDLSNNKTDKLKISDYATNVKAKVWTNILIPINDFIANSGKADLSRIKTIFFGQSFSDSLTHTLYIDDIKMTGNKDSDFNYIVVLGSSTAAGIGPSNIDSSWVNRLNHNMRNLDSTYKIVNLAVGGYSSYHVMPTNFNSPSNRPKPQPANNITYALEFDPKSIIVNLPSNDAAYNYNVYETLANYDTLISIASINDVQIWITTPQPRNFSNQSQMNLLFRLLDSTFSKYHTNVIDFWNGLAQPNGYILNQYNSGDGIHLNNAAHKILYERAAEKVFPQLLPVQLANTINDEEYLLFQNYPNPFNGYTKIYYKLPKNEYINLKLFNVLGQELFLLDSGFKERGINSYNFNAGNLASGVYFYMLKVGNFNLIKKLILVR